MHRRVKGINGIEAREAAQEKVKSNSSEHAEAEQITRSEFQVSASERTKSVHYSGATMRKPPAAADTVRRKVSGDRVALCETKATKNSCALMYLVPRSAG
jgi:hypothetical protein